MTDDGARDESAKRVVRRRKVDFGGGVRGEVVRGRHDGPAVWIWIPGGARAPSMVQAAAALRDRLDVERLHGTVGLLLDGPLLRMGASPSMRGAAHVGLCEATAGAAAVIALVEGPDEQASRLELDVDDARARELARGVGVRVLVKAPRLDGIASPLMALVDGVEHGHTAIDAAVVERAGSVLDAALVSLGMVKGVRPRVRLRVVIRARVHVERGELPGTAQVIVASGDVVRAGHVLALIGAPGSSRHPLVAPTAGVVLSIHRSTGSPVIVLGKVARALARLEALHDTPVERHRIATGWCEWAALPDLGIPRIKAKLDTGARSCALHVRSLKLVAVDEGALPLADIEIPLGRHDRSVTARCPIVQFASVRDSGGHAERRPVIETTLQLGGVSRRVRVSLTDRGDMLFPMLIGRTALGSEFVVDPSSRFRFGYRR